MKIKKKQRVSTKTTDNPIANGILESGSIVPQEQLESPSSINSLDIKDREYSKSNASLTPTANTRLMGIVPPPIALLNINRKKKR